MIKIKKYQVEDYISDATQNALDLKADLVDGKVPSSQLPSYVDDVIEVANYAALPIPGETGVIYITLDTNKVFRWTGSVYVEIASGSTNLSYTPGVSNGTVNSDTGSDAVIPLAGLVNAGLFSAAEKSKLDGLKLQNLQDVTDEGAITTNSIQLIDSAEVLFGTGGGILLDNASRLREGTIDAGLGGSKGIAQICGVGYELKWEAGRLYVMNGNGNGIRESLYNFNIVPTVDDDDTKAYYIGSLWSLDNGDVYECSDATTGAAVWYLKNTGSTPNLQQVTDEGATTTNTITAQKLIKDGGFDFQFLKADGSVDNNTYLTSADLPSTLDLYATTSPDPVIAGYTALVRNIADSRYNTVAVNVPTPLVNGTIAAPTLCGSVISDPSVLLGNPGVFNFTVIGNIRRVSGSTSSGADFFYSIYKRDLAGTEVFIAESAKVPVPANGGLYIEYISTALWNNGIFLSTDRIVLKFYGIQTGGGTGAYYEFLFGGTDPVRGTAAISSAIIPNIYLKDLADVEKTPALDNEILYWNDSDSLWEHSAAVDLIPDATTTQRGLMSTGTQTFAGDKTFTGTTAGISKSMVGLSNVDNTTDLLKPISTATQNALDLKVNSNTAITGATNTKITYDANGLVTAGTTLIASDIPDIAQSQVTSLTTDLGLKAPLASPTFTGTVVLPSTTSIGNVSDTEIGYLDNVTSAIQTQIDGKLTIPVWQNFTSTQVGWSSTTTFIVRYIVINKMVTVYFQVQGTSNSTTTTITMPFNNNSGSVVNLVGNGINSGGVVISNISLQNGSNVLTANYFSSFTTTSSFIASGTKNIRGTITYEIP